MLFTNITQRGWHMAFVPSILAHLPPQKRLPGRGTEVVVVVYRISLPKIALFFVSVPVAPGVL